MDGNNSEALPLPARFQWLGHITDNSGATQVIKTHMMWNMSNIPPGETITSARLVMSQSDSSNLGTGVNWDVYRLQDTAIGHWYLTYGNASWWWTGLSPSAQPIASAVHDVQASTAGVPAVSWEWDVTADFTQAYVQNHSRYALRIEPRNIASVRGAKFFSSYYL